MNKEVHYEGWLIKSPPTKRIWRARWRRRWFTLKQGEIPEQFCLEYYTDRNCRKLKGVIDLDQCEQVDCGLRLENRKQKFQFMFDIKTPRRTYYLAADTEADMRDWVNCICQVCHLHDTKQSSELQAVDNGAQSGNTANLLTGTTTLSSSSFSTNNTTSTSLNSTNNTASAFAAASKVSNTGSNNSDVLRRSTSHAQVIEQQPLSTSATGQSTECSYVNTEYSNRETMLCDSRFDKKQMAQAQAQVQAQVQAKMQTRSPAQAQATPAQTIPTSPGGSAIYLNSPAHLLNESARLAVNSNGVVRKIPENLILNNMPLTDLQHPSMQPSPALSTASGPYIPISECFSGSPKFTADGNNPTTPLNNLDPKFYDTPRSHNNIGLNLTNDQSYSPKITNCSGVQSVQSKNRSGRSDSDSESVFTDDEEWANPLPLRENVDRSTRPSDSSVENESFVFTYSQRFSKLPDDFNSKEQQQTNSANVGTTNVETGNGDTLSKLAKVLKNKNNLILDFKENEKFPRDLPQLSDTENTSPAIGPRDAKSVVDESYDIPRSHNLPYYNMGQLFDKVLTSPEANPIAASTPNLVTDSVEEQNSPSHVRTLQRPHCYTNAAPSKVVEGNVFRYDFIEQSDLPPVNRKLKPKISTEEKTTEDMTSKTSAMDEQLASKLMGAHLQSTAAAISSSTNANTTNINTPCTSATTTTATSALETKPLKVTKPPSVDRKLKPNAYKFRYSATLEPSIRRSTGAPLSMVMPNEDENGAIGGAYPMETRTLPRHPRPHANTVGSSYARKPAASGASTSNSSGTLVQHQRTASAAAAIPATTTTLTAGSATVAAAAVNAGGVAAVGAVGGSVAAAGHIAGRMTAWLENEHKLQYFDLDVANAPSINRQSMSVGNLNGPGMTAARLGLPADPSARQPVRSSVVYNSVDFVKTEAFKRIREERKKENEGVSNNNCVSTNK